MAETTLSLFFFFFFFFFFFHSGGGFLDSCCRASRLFDVPVQIRSDQDAFFKLFVVLPLIALVELYIVVRIYSVRIKEIQEVDYST